ncbi:7845_t:CDS:2 [Ambispora gerdemannii]|uniref:7845_t:CDS:1 n=1 Tax=Ambispora gerdemannii TaxID=144530 RepID=A0A9N9CJ44_9GLOM|nr:7845_t:CDS:2 [Ambispora gerdemannii]
MASDHPDLTFVEPEQVVELVKDKTKVPGKDYLLVDVRDEEYEKHHVPNSVNFPSASLAESVKDLIAEYNQVPQVVFYCGLSQRRGPNSARLYTEALSKCAVKNEQKIVVMKGGFTGWNEKFENDDEISKSKTKKLESSSKETASSSTSRISNTNNTKSKPPDSNNNQISTKFSLWNVQINIQPTDIFGLGMMANAITSCVMANLRFLEKQTQTIVG